MPRPRQEIIDNPIPTSLLMCYAAVLLFVGTRDAILRPLVNVYTIEKHGSCLENTPFRVIKPAEESCPRPT